MKDFNELYNNIDEKELNKISGDKEYAASTTESEVSFRQTASAYQPEESFQPATSAYQPEADIKEYKNEDAVHLSDSDENPLDTAVSAEKVDFITIKSAKKEKSKKMKVRAYKATAAAAIFVVCAGAVGFGASSGYNFSKNFIEKNDASSFQFADSGSDTMLIPNDDSNIMLTSTNTVAPIIKEVKDSVVNILIKAKTTDFFNQLYETSGSGSGIIFKEDTDKVYILTNNHVIDGATSVSISITGTEQVTAILVGKDPQSDLAVISVLKTDLTNAGINSVTVAKFADSDTMEVGEYVLALGNALGEGKTVTQGIISAQNKNINIDGKKLTVIQTDAAINPGNSGGALINTDGEVVGINTAKLSSSAIEGIGYAIPSNIALSTANELLQNGTVQRPYFGIMGFTINDNFRSMYNLNLEGVFISSVEENSSAADAGLKSTDIIVSYNGETIKTIEDLSAAISASKVNDTVTIGIIRNGVQSMNITATLKSNASNF